MALDLDSLTLDHGSHRERDHGVWMIAVGKAV